MQHRSFWSFFSRKTKWQTSAQQGVASIRVWTHRERQATKLSLVATTHAWNYKNLKFCLLKNFVACRMRPVRTLSAISINFAKLFFLRFPFCCCRSMCVHTLSFFLCFCLFVLTVVFGCLNCLCFASDIEAVREESQVPVQRIESPHAAQQDQPEARAQVKPSAGESICRWAHLKSWQQSTDATVFR